MLLCGLGRRGFTLVCLRCRFISVLVRLFGWMRTMLLLIVCRTRISMLLLIGRRVLLLVTRCCRVGLLRGRLLRMVRLWCVVRGLRWARRRPLVFTPCVMRMGLILVWVTLVRCRLVSLLRLRMCRFVRVIARIKREVEVR